MQVMFSEVMSNPPLEGELREIGEYIELFNPTEVIANLEGWILDDTAGGSSAPRTLSKDIVVPPLGYLLLPSSVTKITLNNEGEALSLISPDGTISISMTYPEMERGESYALLGNDVCITSLPTPGKKNLCRQTLAATKNEQRTTSSALRSSPSPLPSPLSTLRTKYRPLFIAQNESILGLEESPSLHPLLAAIIPKIVREDLPPLLLFAGNREIRSALRVEHTLSLLAAVLFPLFLTLEAAVRMKNMV